MPWVRLDDRFPSHRKVALLSDKAFRLHVTAMCWSSENLTEGKILDTELPVISHVRGIKTAARELEQRKLWDRVDDGWVIHDFLDYNPDREKVQAERASNAARQKALRERRKARKDAESPPPPAAEPGDSNAVTNAVTNGVSNAPVTPPPARPVPPPLTGEGEQASYAREPDPAAPPADDGLPAVLQPLADALHHAGIRGVLWPLQGDTAIRIHNLMTLKGIDAMALAAQRAAERAHRPVARITYFLNAWQELPNLPTGPPPGSGITQLRTATGAGLTRRQQGEAALAEALANYRPPQDPWEGIAT